MLGKMEFILERLQKDFHEHTKMFHNCKKMDNVRLLGHFADIKRSKILFFSTRIFQVVDSVFLPVLFEWFFVNTKVYNTIFAKVDIIVEMFF